MEKKKSFQVKVLEQPNIRMPKKKKNIHKELTSDVGVNSKQIINIKTK
jgi:hypothetical protein